MLTPPHLLPVEHGRVVAGSLSPHSQHSGTGSQPPQPQCLPCSRGAVSSPPLPNAANLLSAGKSMQPGMRRVPREPSPPAEPTCRRTQGPDALPHHQHPCCPHPKGHSPERLGLRGLGSSWGHEMEKGQGQSDPGKASVSWHGRNPTASFWLPPLAISRSTGGCARWMPSCKGMPGPGSCPSPELGVGAQDPRFVALSPEVLSSSPLPLHPTSTTRTAAHPGTGGTQCPTRPLCGPGLSVAWGGLCGCFSVLPPPW